VLLSLTQWAVRPFGREEIWKTFVFAFTLCYTGFSTKMSDPCAKIMAKSGTKIAKGKRWLQTGGVGDS
jgi:hypothetical protein